MAQGETIDTIVFDIGGVLLDRDRRHLYRKLFADEAAREWLLSHVCTPDWNREQDRRRPWAEAVAGLAQVCPEWRAEIAACDARWSETIAGPIEGSVDILRRLHANGAPLYAITSFSAGKFELAKARFDFL
jgi:2-haloacid dehalogenase